MNSGFPRVAKGRNLFRLPSGILRLSVFNVSPPCANPTSALRNTECRENAGDSRAAPRFQSLSRASFPGLYWTNDLRRHPERLVENPVIRLRCGAPPNAENTVLVGGQNDRRNLVRREQLTHRRPRRMNLLTEQRRLDGYQQMVRQEAKGTLLLVIANRVNWAMLP